jgi:hypothetical protein
MSLARSRVHRDWTLGAEFMSLPLMFFYKCLELRGRKWTKMTEIIEDESS